MSSAITAVAIGTAISAGGAAYSGAKGKKAQEAMLAEERRINEMNYRPEPKKATSLWWDKMEEFGGQEGYGAITPDWGDIWENAKQKVRSYYQGTATQTGAIDKIKAGAARRGVSDSPALDAEITKALVEQGGQMAGMARDESIAKAEFSEKGRLEWLRGIQDLANSTGGTMGQVRPYTPASDGIGEAMGIVGGGISSMGMMGMGSAGGASGGGQSGYMSKNYGGTKRFANTGGSGQQPSWM